MKKITIQDKYIINIPLSNDEYKNNIIEEKIEKRSEIIDTILKEEE